MARRLQLEGLMRLARTVAALVLVSLTLSSTLALAEEQPNHDQRVWYGWQGLSTDALAIGMVALAAGLDFRGEEQTYALLLGSLGTYLLGAPMVHYAHGHHRRAAQSFGLRVGLPLATALVVGGAVAAADDCHQGDDDLCGLVPVAYGMLGGVVGMGTAMLIDGVVLSYDEAPRERSWTPVLAPSSGGMTLGLAGTW